MKIEDKIDQNKGDRRVNHTVHRIEKPYILTRYHVINNICIHLRVNDSRIYMYRRERIYKELLKI
jgi:hypothetical protein